MVPNFPGPGLRAFAIEQLTTDPATTTEPEAVRLLQSLYSGDDDELMRDVVRHPELARRLLWMLRQQLSTEGVSDDELRQMMDEDSDLYRPA